MPTGLRQGAREFYEGIASREGFRSVYLVGGHGGGGPADAGRSVREALGVLRVGVVESDLAAGSDLFDAAVEYLGRSEERKSRMLVMVIIPGEELLTPSSRMGERSEPLRIVGLVLQRLELRLGEGVVVADVRTAEAAHDADGSEELCEALRPHRGAAIGVHRERTAGDAVALDSLGEEVLGELGALPLGEQPANRHATEQVEDHIEAVEDPVQRTAQLGNIALRRKQGPLISHTYDDRR